MKEECTVLGGLILDRYFEVNRWPLRGQDCIYDNEKVYVGGCAINMAVTFNNLGGNAHVVSAVGNDPEADLIFEYLSENHISNRFIKKMHGKTGGCMVFREPDGERTFITKKGIEGCFFKDMLSDAGNELSHLGLTGYYFIDNSSHEIMSFLKDCKKNGSKILFDPSPLVVNIKKEELAELIKMFSICTPNDSELEFLGGEGFIRESIAENKTIIVKHGSKGGTVYTKDDIFDYKAQNTKVVDTTGAGDSFSGALLYAMTENMSIDKAVELAARCASKTVGIYGPHGFWKLEDE